jgi:hypothetical protein
MSSSSLAQSETAVEHLRRYAWLLPVLAFYVALLAAGAPGGYFIVALAIVSAIAELARFAPAKTTYLAGFALLIACPLWLVVEATSLFGRIPLLYSVGLRVHLDPPTDVATSCADMAFALLAAGMIALAVRPASPRISE